MTLKSPCTRALLVACFLLFPAGADAQWRYPFGYGYDPWYRADLLTSTIRLQVSPREAEVYVDGYAAGPVDDFDGMFQRLRLRPGPHEITIFLNGYRTVSRAIYFNPGQDQSLKLALEPVQAGERSEPPPPPSQTAAPDPRYPPAMQGRLPPRAEPPPTSQEQTVRFGALAISVQPADAEIFIDGDRWTLPEKQTRLHIRLSEGRHRVEVKKDGFATYTETIAIARDRTLTLNVSLRKPG